MENNIFAEFVCKNAHILKLFLDDKNNDPSTNNNAAIRYAAHNGHLEVVRLLLADNRVNPADDNNSAIQNAARNGHLEVVRLLAEWYLMHEMAIDNIMDIIGNNNKINLAELRENLEDLSMIKFSGRK